MFNKEPDQYTWWSYRTKVRDRNVGWKLDYFFVNEEFKDNVKDSYMLYDVMGSDHCPIGLKIEIGNFLNLLIFFTNLLMELKIIF